MAHAFPEGTDLPARALGAGPNLFFFITSRTRSGVER